MSQLITAIFENGVLKPEEELHLPSGAKVQLFLLAEIQDNGPCTMGELDRLCDEEPIHGHGLRLTRDQLHERR